MLGKGSREDRKAVAVVPVATKERRKKIALAARRVTIASAPAARPGVVRNPLMPSQCLGLRRLHQFLQSTKWAFGRVTPQQF
jgi:hypothetical protein